MLAPLVYAFGVFLLALVSPGPDFAVTVKNSLTRGRRAGLLCAAGVTLANSLHILVANLGVGAVIASSPLAYIALVWTAAVYLGYLGLRLLLSKRTAPPSGSHQEPPYGGKESALRAPLLEGFLVNVLNAKAILFWVSFFALVLREALPASVRAGFVAAMILTLLGWFSFVAQVLSRPRARGFFFEHELGFNRIMGLLLLVLAIRVAATT
jgi:threonine/homoserine/homoserine lactone efflux protein